jgi:beta-galactosidase
MFLGMAYYPEWHPRERWSIDAKLMHEVHIEAARMGEFAWCRFEPNEGVFDFDWMDEAIDTLSKDGVKTIMCTPTPTPPAWLIHKHPEILPIGENGLVSNPFGSRRHYCCNVPSYNEYTRKIVATMAEHYGENTNVIGWQIDNELAQTYRLAAGRCYCETCRKKFSEWLNRKYGSLEALNKAWGTVFWSQEYSNWDQIVLPRRGIASEGLNPSHVLDYYRFFSDSWAEYTTLQAEILRKHVRNQWISTNFAAGGGSGSTMHKADCHWFPCIVNWRNLSKSLDFPAWSAHVDPSNHVASICDDFLRGIREDGKFACLEIGAVRMRLYQRIARGSIGLAAYRWEATLSGAESGFD